MKCNIKIKYKKIGLSIRNWRSKVCFFSIKGEEMIIKIEMEGFVFDLLILVGFYKIVDVVGFESGISLLRSDIGV